MSATPQRDTRVRAARARARAAAYVHACTRVRGCFVVTSVPARARAREKKSARGEIAARAFLARDSR
jgi:hypothetical protein